MKDFFIFGQYSERDDIDQGRLAAAIEKVFTNRGTKLEYLTAFTSYFHNNPELITRWKNFQSALGATQVDLKGVISEISDHIRPLIPNLPL